MERLGGDYRALTDQYEAVLNRCGDEDRDPTDSEVALLDGLRSEMEPLGERLVQLRDDEDRRTAAVRAMARGGDNGTGTIEPVNGDGGGAAVQTRRHALAPLTVPEHQIRAIVQAAHDRQPYNELVETRAAITTPVAGSVPFWSYPPVPSGVEGRIADSISTRPADTGDIVSYLAVTAPAVLAAVAEGAPKPDSGLVVSRRQATLVKGAAFSDMSWEMVADFDGVEATVNLELQSGLIRFENAQIVSTVVADAGILKPTPAATSPLISIWQAKQAVRAAPNVGTPDLCVMHPNDWAVVAAELAATSGLLLGGEQAVQLGPAETVWGMQLLQSVAVTPTHVLLGVSDAAAFFLREGPRVLLDIYTKSVSNLQTLILEERFAVGVLNPGRWCYFTLPGGAVTAEDEAKAKK
jgi:hypothetical protein